ncbi:MAG: hypothetical protein ACR2PL_00665, partial [Dehalococcoidia bacterium]
SPATRDPHPETRPPPSETRAPSPDTRPFERFLLYWSAAAVLSSLATPGREVGQLPFLLAPLALAAGIAFSRWLASGPWAELRAGLPPTLLALPAFVYVLFVLQAATSHAAPASRGLGLSESIILVLFLAGGGALLGFAAWWCGRSTTVYLAICGLFFGFFFALHSLTRVDYGNGDEYLLGAVSSSQAPALAQEIARVAPALNGRVSIDPSLTEPLAWYTRDNLFVRIEPANRASVGAVRPVDQTSLSTFQTLLANTEISRAWYPSSNDPEAIIRWLLYRQAWGPVNRTTAQFLVK